MDFYEIRVKEQKNNVREVYPEFNVERTADLMVRGNDFYAIWDEEVGLWSTDEYDVARLVDADLKQYILNKDPQEYKYKPLYLRNSGNGHWYKYRRYLREVKDNSKQLDARLTFTNTKIKRSDYVSKTLPYALDPGDFSSWDELVGTLYNPEERAKIEWAIGSIVSGDSVKIQKFIVFYGPTGSGKSTILNVIHKLFEGYTSSFDARALGSANGGFAMEAFSGNPLVAIQHDGDLSKLSDNTKLNSIVAHEVMRFNEKYKRTYDQATNAFVFMGTNQPVKITDSKSGLIRRLIDVHPNGNKILNNHYNTLMSRIDFELGAIAHHCLEVYRDMGKNFYNTYRPLVMMYQTDAFFNFIEAYFDVFKAEDGTTLKSAFAKYKEFCEEAGIDQRFSMLKFRDELSSYFNEFEERAFIHGQQVRSYFSGFNANKFRAAADGDVFSVVIEDTTSLFDNEFMEYPAQEATDEGTPKTSWSNVKTTLAQIDTSKLHYVKVPENHIVIDFDLKDETNAKSLDRNLAAASLWPHTYAELSKSGNGVHLHYNYDGDVTELSNEYEPGIEVKVFTGNSSLRRKLTKCNGVPIATLSGGLPLKEKKKVLETQTIKSEKGLRDLINRNLRKEIHPGTKPSIDFIYKILEEAYESGMSFDVTDMQPRILAFANNSRNQPLQALKTVQKMRFKSGEPARQFDPSKEGPLVFFDCEVYPNLLIVCWKRHKDDIVVRMINPLPHEVEALFKFKLIGFNNRRYDNHILYARFMGYDNDKLFKLSQKIIDNNVGATFGEAYNISYTDVWDFSSKKQGLKKFEVELGLNHMELDLPWDQPVDPAEWIRVEEYCVNDVLATEAVFEARKQDFVARQILADMSGLSVNDTTQKHTAKIIFGSDRRPQDSFIYKNLAEEFPGYQFDLGKSTYRGEVTGEGGYVFSQPGAYYQVALLDIASMHPTSIEALNLFGEYTRNFSALKDARMSIKHKDFDGARRMLDGKLIPYLENPDNIENVEALSHALKIVINSVYGYTSAKFDNLFRDTRNKDNIVAKRGALFMIDLKHAVQDQGFIVAHIKTDSIKIPDATPEIIDFVIKFGHKYGYDFEHEKTFEKMCLVNDAVYVAKEGDVWHAVGAQFQHPYVFKKLFSHDDLIFDDFVENKFVTQGVMYLDFDAVQKPMYDYKGKHFIGRAGQFVPVTKESGGGLLIRVKDDKQYAVSGTKDYFWVEAKLAKNLGCEGVTFDLGYFEALLDDAVKAINKYCDWEVFVD